MSSEGELTITVSKRFLAEIRQQLVEAKKLSKMFSKLRVEILNLEKDYFDRLKKVDRAILEPKSELAQKMNEDICLDFQIRLDLTLEKMDQFNLKSIKLDDIVGE